jgi:hypothetical protein
VVKQLGIAGQTFYRWRKEYGGMKIKEWTSLDSGSIEHKLYCSYGDTGMLVLVEELKGKTVYVEPFEGGFIAPPPPAAGPPSPVPVCEKSARCIRHRPRSENSR